MKSLGPALCDEELVDRRKDGAAVLVPKAGGDRQIGLGDIDGLVVETSMRRPSYGPYLLLMGVVVLASVPLAMEEPLPTIAALMILGPFLYALCTFDPAFVVGRTRSGTVVQRLIVDRHELARLTTSIATASASPDA